MTKRFHLAEDVQSATICPRAPSFAVRTSARKGAKADGLRYERKVQDHLSALSDHYLVGPWILYVIEGRPFWCQPDGLHFDVARGLVTIVEIKLRHTPEAQRQLRGVYEPVIRRMFPHPFWGVRLVEVCRWFDPDTRFPEPFTMIDEPLAHKSQTIGVCVCKP